MIGISVNVIDPDLYFGFLEDAVMASNFMTTFGYMRSFGIATFQNGLQYRLPIQKYSMAIY